MNPETTHTPQVGAHQPEGAETQGRSMAPPAFNLASTPPPAAPPAPPATPPSAEGNGSTTTAKATEGLDPEGPVAQPHHHSSHAHAATVALDYAVPLQLSDVQASAGENMIFRVVAHKNDPASTDNYEIRFAITGAAEFNGPGSGLTSLTRPGLSSQNVVLVCGAGFNSGTIRVQAVIRNTTTNHDELTRNWSIRPRPAAAPTSLRKIDGPAANTWVAGPGIYTYKGEPDRGGDGRPDYAGQSVLESFGQFTALGFGMNDLTPAWRAANPTANTPDKAIRLLFNSVGNGTFVFDATDRIADQHDGFCSLTPFEPTALNDADGVGVRMPQVYSIGSNVIGRCNVDYRFTTARRVEVRKADPA